jgi:ubiquitin-conjugating enzyme E2 C
MDISDSRNVRAYSPTSIASKNSLSSIASFLGYIHYNGDLTNELIYGLSKKVPFAPLINGLVMISQNKELKFKEIIQITAPLHTLLADAYSYVRKEDLFKMIPDFLPYLVCGDMALPNMIYYNTSPNKIIKANTDELSHKIDNFVINKKEFYAIDMTDLGSIERIQFEYNPIPEVLKECNKKIKIFKPKSVMECMKINRPALIEEDGFIELYTGNITKDEDKSNVKKQVAYISPDDGGFIKLIDPQEGERKSKDYIADGVVCVAVDLSGSMGCTYIPGISNVEAAKKCFKMLAQKAFDFATLNWYGLVEFGRESYATKMIEIQKIPEDFKDILNEAHAYGGTPMWSAIRLSIDMLLETKKNKEACKDAPMKIILLTDGDAGDYCDNSITYRLKENGIRIDAICIGSSIPRELYYIAKYTGGYIFNPKTIEDIEDLAESEPLFDMSICKYKPFMEKYYMLSFIMFLLPCDNVDVDILSKSTEIDYSKYVSPEWIMDNYNFDDESVSEASINEEIKKFDECISIKPLINRYSITEWVILIQLSEYNNLWYALRVTFPTDYPYKAPTVRFINPPYHVNVTKFGRIYPDIKSYHQNPFNLMKYIKDVQQLLNTPFDQLRMTDLFDKFAPADSEHERTFNDEYKYQLAKANSYANGKNTPEDFC